MVTVATHTQEEQHSLQTCAPRGLLEDEKRAPQDTTELGQDQQNQQNVREKCIGSALMTCQNARKTSRTWGHMQRTKCDG